MKSTKTLINEKSPAALIVWGKIFMLYNVMKNTKTLINERLLNPVMNENILMSCDTKYLKAARGVTKRQYIVDRTRT